MRLISSMMLATITMLSIQTLSSSEQKTGMPAFFKHFQSLETEHLIIRKLALSDAKDCFAITSDLRVLKMMVALPVHKTLEETEQYLADIIAQYEQDKNEWWAVVEKTSDKVIGFCGFVDYKVQFKRVELGYMLAYDSWGKGYATEACKTNINFGFSQMNLNRIEATVDPENIPSVRVLEKLGMQYEGLLQKRVICDGQPRDRRMYGLLQKIEG